MLNHEEWCCVESAVYLVLVSSHAFSTVTTRDALDSTTKSLTIPTTFYQHFENKVFETCPLKIIPLEYMIGGKQLCKINSHPFPIKMQIDTKTH